MALSVTNFTAGDVITASAMNANFAAVENYVNSSPGMAALTGATFSGLVTANAGLTATGTITITGATSFGSDGAGVDVTFHSATAGDSFFWDASDKQLTITGTNAEVALSIADGNVTIADDLDVDGATSLDNLEFTGTLSGTNSVPRMAYRGDGAATVASNQMNANPTIFICTTEPTATSTGDIWIDI